MRKQIVVPNVREASVQVNYNHVRKNAVCNDTHIHTEYEITLCICGKITYLINDTDEYTMEEGDVIFINSNVPHSTVAYPGTFYIPIIFSYNNQTSDNLIPGYIYLNYNDHIFIENGTPAAVELKDCITKMQQEYVGKLPYYQNYIKSYMHKLIAVLLRYDMISDASKIIKSDNIKRFMPVIEYVNKKYMDHITLEDVSHILHIDKSHFCRVFKSTFEISFVDYLNSVRLFHAERMLMTTEETIADISNKCGFSTPEYFGKMFKKYNHCTPTEYKKYKTNNEVKNPSFKI